MTNDMDAVVMPDEQITLDHFIRVALALREQKKDCSEDELFKAAWVFLSRAKARYFQFVHGTPLWWFEEAFLPPTIPLDDAARRITSKRNKAEAMIALEKFLPSWAFKECILRGELGANFCDQAKKDYRKLQFAPLREKQRQVGRRTKNLKRGTKKPKKFR